MTIKKSKVKQTSRGSWIFPDGISLPPAKFAKLMRGPRTTKQGEGHKGTRAQAAKKDLTSIREYGIK